LPCKVYGEAELDGFRAAFSGARVTTAVTYDVTETR